MRLVYHAFLVIALPIVLHLPSAGLRIEAWRMLEALTPDAERFCTR